MDSVHRRIGQLNDEEMHRQVWFIRASLASLDADGDSPFVPTYRLVEAQTSASQARLFAGVQAVADHLVATAIYGKDDVAWVGMDLVRERNWEIVPLGDDLYGGISGIALFLAYAGANLHNEEYTALAQRAAYTMVRHIVMFGAEMGGTGGFKGWGGTLYALTHLALLWDDPRLLSQAHDMVDVLAGLVVEENKFDLTEGAAGAIVTLLAFHHCVPSSKTLGVAIAFGEQLVASAQSTTHGVSWANPSLDEKPPKLLIGLGHGNAGIALALLKLAAVTGNEHYRVIAQQAIDHERTLFVPQAETWDERSHAAQFSDAQFSAEERTLSSVPQISWFQGVAGIGLARLYALEHLNDPKLYDEIEMALQMTLTHGFGQSHSLSYGDMGNLEFLLQASQLLNNSPFHMERERMAAMLLDSIERDGWQCAGPKGVEMPGLMLGLAGIGYEMLRLALPDLVPSVLVLAPPISRPN
jgi:type 2 lantibiotic biosynthesis protein LanM